MDVFVARQPVFTRNKKLYGYELLFRHNLENSFSNIDGDIATSRVLANTFFTFDLKEILSGKPGLVNFTKDLILQHIPLLFPQEHIIIEVLENIQPEKKIIDALKLFKKKGFDIALDDFVYHEKFLPMIDLCRIIKFDLRATSLGSITEIIHDIKSNFKIILLAEKVETYKEFKLAKEMGFDLFQGYFFSKPEILSAHDLSPGQITKLKLINEVGKKDFDLEIIEALVKNDVSVSFKLLTFLNAAYFNRVTPVTTIKDAITHLGTIELRKFIRIVVLSDLSENKPDELIRSSILRARMCEQCGSILKSSFTTEELFTIGLFSYIDAILDNTMTNILNNISFPDKITIALLGKDKEFQKITAIINSFEKGDWDNNLYDLISGTIIERKLPEFYFNAITTINSFFEG